MPHVVVALRMKAQGKSEAELVNNFIPYVICKLPNGKDATKLGDAAFSPDEYMDKNKDLQLDIQWYITQQILPPISRLIEHIEEI